MKTAFSINPSALLLAAALVCLPGIGFSQPSSAPNPGQDQTTNHAKQDARKAGHESQNAAKDAGHSAKEGTSHAYDKTKHGTQKAYYKSKEGTEKTYDKSKSATKGAIHGGKQGAEHSQPQQ